MTPPLPRRISRIVDTTFLVALFDGYGAALRLMQQGDAGRLDVYFPAVCMAEAEQELLAGESGWAAIRLFGGLQEIHLAPAAAVEVGSWPGTLGVRHAVWEARHLRGSVVTLDSRLYKGLDVDLTVL